MCIGAGVLMWDVNKYKPNNNIYYIAKVLTENIDNLN